MRSHLLALVCAAIVVNPAQQASPDRAALRTDLESAFSFEAPATGDMPTGWSGGPPGTIFQDNKTVHDGQGAVRIERSAANTNGFSTIVKTIPMDFTGKAIELRGFLRTEDVDGFVGLWVREDGETPSLAFDNMHARQLRGTTDWTSYSIQLPVIEGANKLAFGVLLSGKGKAWADDLELLVDGKPVWETRPLLRVKTVLDTDHQFDGGSGIAIAKLNPAQIENLTMLGKVWGFLKYHHPAVTSGERQWDFDLFRVLPTILAATDRSSANSALLHWIDSLGPVEPCRPCAKLETKDLSLRPDLDWIADEAWLGAELSARLRSIYKNRTPATQFYLEMAREVGNPVFKHELAYEGIRFPDAGFQLLALYRLWNIFEYWSPYRDVMGEDWNHTLAEFIPQVALAATSDAYKREMLAFIARAHDGHANLWNALAVRPPVGQCTLPIGVRFMEGLPVITSLATASPGEKLGLQIGDVITDIDGVAISRQIAEWSPYYSTSNDAARMRDIGHYMTRGACGDSTISVRRENQGIQLTVKRVPSTINDFDPGRHDLPGAAFRLLSKDVAYLKLSAVKAADCPQYVQQAVGTRGFIIDIRNYPSEFVVFALGTLLVDRETDFARFTDGDLSNPGAFSWTKPVSLEPQKPHYPGKIVILVDESSMSQAEYTAMAFRAAKGAIVVGSTTSGADGNVSQFTLPGDLHTMISGIGVFYPDRKPTQRIGIVPDIEIKPTVQGIRAGRDEVLEKAIREIAGNQIPMSEIEEMAAPK